MPALVINVGNGEALDEAIARYIKRKYDITIAARTAEEIRLLMGSAMPLDENVIMDVRGRDQAVGLSRTIQMHANEVTEPLEAIIRVVRARRETLPPDQISAIGYEGCCITGYAALLRKMTVLLHEAIGVPFFVAENLLAG